MKQIKVIVEYKKNDYENELAKFISKGFKVLQSNITFSNFPIITSEEKENYNSTNKAIIQNLKDSLDINKSITRQNVEFHIVYYALLINED